MALKAIFMPSLIFDVADSIYDYGLNISQYFQPSVKKSGNGCSLLIYGGECYCINEELQVLERGKKETGGIVYCTCSSLEKQLL